MTDTKLIKLLALNGLWAPSADNSQPWRFDWDGHSLVIGYDSERVAGHTFPPESQATLISAGCAIESIVKFANTIGLEVDMAYRPQGTGRSHPYATITPRLSPVPAPETANQPVTGRHTNRCAYKSKPLPAPLLTTIGGDTEGKARVHTFDQTESVRQIWRLVRSATEIRFQTREVHEWLGKSLRFGRDGRESGDGLHVSTLCLPPGGGLLLRFVASWPRMKRLNRIGAYKLLATVDAQPVKKAPAMLAFTAPNTPDGALDAGRLLDRVWTHLNNEGVACHPYYVVADQLSRLAENTVPDHLTGQARALQEECGQLLNLRQGETLMMFLRTGYPTRQAPPSARLPLERVFRNQAG